MKLVAEIAVESKDPRALFFAAMGAAGAHGVAPSAYLKAREAAPDPSAHDFATLLRHWELLPDMAVEVVDVRAVRRAAPGIATA